MQPIIPLTTNPGFQVRSFLCGVVLGPSPYTSQCLSKVSKQIRAHISFLSSVVLGPIPYTACTSQCLPEISTQCLDVQRAATAGDNRKDPQIGQQGDLPGDYLGFYCLNKSEFC